MSNFRPINRDPGFLLPPSVDEWLPERHLARFGVEVVDQLDLSAMVKAYRGSGSASYHPAMLLGLLIYGYATKVFSSRAIERATYDSVAFRFIAANEHPDHDTIATFRKRFLPQIEVLFVDVLKLARAMGVLKLGTVALDGTKLKANASRHSALSYGHAKKLEKQLKREVRQLLKLAEQADAADVPDGMSIPEELARREARLAAIAHAKQKIEARASEREYAEYDAKLEARAEREKQTGNKPRGRPPEPASGKVDDKEQINLTDEESRIMPVSGGGFEQCYNAQAAVAAAKIEPLIALGRERHPVGGRKRFAPAPKAPPDSATPMQKMAHRLKTPSGKALYALRKPTAEPVFGIIKSVMGFNQFSLRGFDNVKGEWNLVTMSWNIKRMFALSPG